MPDFTASPYHVPSRYDGKNLTLTPAPEINPNSARRQLPGAPDLQNYMLHNISVAAGFLAKRDILIEGELTLERRVKLFVRHRPSDIGQLYSKLSGFRDIAMLAQGDSEDVETAAGHVDQITPR
jgi:hypothetical protein